MIFYKWRAQPGGKLSLVSGRGFRQVYIHLLKYFLANQDNFPPYEQPYEHIPSLTSVLITGSSHFIANIATIKACLHLQILLGFLVRFADSDGCEQVDEL